MNNLTIALTQEESAMIVQRAIEAGAIEMFLDLTIDILKEAKILKEGSENDFAHLFIEMMRDRLYGSDNEKEGS